MIPPEPGESQDTSLGLITGNIVDPQKFQGISVFFWDWHHKQCLLSISSQSYGTHETGECPNSLVLHGDIQGASSWLCQSIINNSNFGGLLVGSANGVVRQIVYSPTTSTTMLSHNWFWIVASYSCIIAGRSFRRRRRPLSCCSIHSYLEVGGEGPSREA